MVETKLLIAPEEADRGREIFRIYLDQGSIISIIADLNRRGWRTKGGSQWDEQGLRRLLENPLYIGKVACNGDVFPNQHEAIVDEETWEAVQHQLRHPRKRTTFRSRSGAILAGIIRCGACGAAMSPHYTKKGTRRWGSYCCQTMQRQGAKACPGSRVSQPVVEKFVVDRIREVGRDPKVFRETIKATKKALEARKTEIGRELKAIDAEAEKLADERRNLVAAVSRGGSGIQSLVARLGEVEKAHQEATGKAEALRGEQAALETRAIDEADLKKALASFSPVWDELFPAEKARVLRLLVEEVRYHASKGEIEITFRPGGIRVMAGEATA